MVDCIYSAEITVSAECNGKPIVSCVFAASAGMSCFVGDIPTLDISVFPALCLYVRASRGGGMISERI